MVPVTMLVSACLQVNDIIVDPENLFSIAECTQEGWKMPRRVRPDTMSEKAETGLKFSSAGFGIMSTYALKSKRPKEAAVFSGISVGFLGASQALRDRCGNFQTPTHS
jgi:hypothetical protein